MRHSSLTILRRSWREKHLDAAYTRRTGQTIRWSICYFAISSVVISCMDSQPIVAQEHSDVDTTVQWETSFGLGGGTIPKLPSVKPPDGPGGLTRVEGAIFPGGREVLFIGQHKENELALTPTELLDTFASSLRLLEEGRAPTVSIDPTSEQITRGLRDADEMPVNYFGLENRRIGYAMFEADRKMKVLGMGRDNVSRQEVKSTVEGYFSQLDLDHLDNGFAAAPWTRFWIEIESSKIEESTDRRTVLANPRMAVLAKPQSQQSVVDSNRNEIRRELNDDETAEILPSAEQFARHLTRFFDKPDAEIDFSSEFPIFRELLLHASLTSIAEAIRRQNETSGVQPVFDTDWLLNDYQISPHSTEETTPAMVVAKTTTKGNMITTRTLSGGVDLTPKNRYLPLNAHNQLAQRARAARARNPKKKYWRFNAAGEVHHLYSLGFTPTKMSVWQTDMQVGPIEILRDYSVSDKNPRFGQDWSLRIPSVSASPELVAFNSGQRLPPFYRVTDATGVTQTLNVVGTVTLPGNPATQSYSRVSAQGRNRRLLLYPNVWLYIDGEVQFVSINGGPVEWRLAQDTTVMRFSPDAPNQLLAIERASGRQEYIYRQDRLIGIKDSAGQSATIHYNTNNFVDRISSNSGQSVAYEYSLYGYLELVKNSSGSTMAYQRNPNSKELSGMAADFSRQPLSRGRFEFNRQVDWSDVLRVGQSAAMSEIGYVGIRRDASSPITDYQVFVSGRFRDVTDRVTEIIESFASGSRTKQAEARLYLGDLKTFENGPLLIVGPTNVVNIVSRTLKVASRDLQVFTATDPSRARDSILATGGRGFQLQFVDGSITSPTGKTIEDLDTGIENGHVVIFVGRASSELENKIRELGNRLDGKIVAILTTNTSSDGLTNVAMEYGARAVMRLDTRVSVATLVNIARALTEEFAVDFISVKELHNHLFQLINRPEPDHADKTDSLGADDLIWQIRIGMLPRTLKQSIVKLSNLQNSSRSWRRLFNSMV